MAQTALIQVEVSNKERTEIFNQLVDLLDHYNLNDVAACSGKSLAMLYQWMHGTTTHPRISSIIAVAGALGYEIVLRKKGMKRHLTSVKS